MSLSVGEGEVRSKRLGAIVRYSRLRTIGFHTLLVYEVGICGFYYLV